MTNRRLLHLDMDAFFASVEQRDDEALRGRPVVVGGRGRRGVVAAASYEARQFGIHSAMPMHEARRRCPDAVVCSPRFEVYEYDSARVQSILRRVTDLVEPVSLDEAFLDVSRVELPWDRVARELRAAIRDEVGLPSSVGGGSTKTIAKLASAAAKPDGQRLLEPDDELPFLHALGVGKLWGVGPKTQAALEAMGVETIGQLATLGRDVLVDRFGSSRGSTLWALARNDDAREVVTTRKAKSVGNRRTFDHDVSDRTEMRRELGSLARLVARRLDEANLSGRCVTVVVRHPDFTSTTKQTTLPAPVSSVVELVDVACELLEEVPTPRGVRLLGVVVSRLSERDAPLDRGQARQDADRWTAGDRFVHPVWGEGLVVAVDADWVSVSFGSSVSPVKLSWQDPTVARGPSSS